MYNNNTSHCLNISSYFLSWSSFASTSDSSEPEIGLPSAVDFFTLSLHRSSGRHLLVVRCCARQMSMAFKNGGNSHQLRQVRHALQVTRKQLRMRPSLIYIQPITAKFGSCPIALWQSYCHQIRFVEQSTLSCYRASFPWLPRTKLPAETGRLRL